MGTIPHAENSSCVVSPSYGNTISNTTFSSLQCRFQHRGGKPKNFFIFPSCFCKMPFNISSKDFPSAIYCSENEFIFFSKRRVVSNHEYIQFVVKLMLNMIAEKLQKAKRSFQLPFIKGNITTLNLLCEFQRMRVLFCFVFFCSPHIGNNGCFPLRTFLNIFQIGIMA